MEDGGHACDSYSLRGATFFLSRFALEIRENVDEKILPGNGNEFFKVSLDKNFEQRITSIFLINKIPSIRALITWKIPLFSFSP